MSKRDLINHGWTRMRLVNACRYCVWTCVVMLGCLAIAAESIAITATPRYPWNGKVDLKFTIDGTSGTPYDTSFTAKDVVGGTNLTMKTLYKADGTAANAAKEQLLPGTYNWVWDATSDCGVGFVGERIVVEGKVQEKLLLPITLGLVAYWSFDGDINDHSGNSHHLSGTAPSWVADRLGNAGKAASFSGSLMLSQTTDLGVTKNMTFACWAKPGTALNLPSWFGINLGVGNYGLDNRGFPIVMLPSNGSNSKTGIGFAIATDRCDVLARAHDGGLYNDPCVIMDCECSLNSGWHHVAITINNNGAPVLYVDSVKQNVKAVSVAGTYYLSKSSAIGGGEFASSEELGHGKTIYKGGLDELCIYNRALSATEVKQLYQAK